MTRPVSTFTCLHDAGAGLSAIRAETEAHMKREALMKQLDALCQVYETGVSINNEWYSVGMEPPAENVKIVKSVWRKMVRLAKQLNVELG